jgi:hypothetical protein
MIVFGIQENHGRIFLMQHSLLGVQWLSAQIANIIDSGVKLELVVISMFEDANLVTTKNKGASILVTNL